MTHPTTIYKRNRPASVAANARTQAAERASYEKERADLIAALDPLATMTVVELEMLQMFRGFAVVTRGSFYQIMTWRRDHDRQTGGA